MTILLTVETNAQTQTNVNDTTSKVVIALGKIVNGIPIIVVFDNSKPIDTAAFRSLTTLIAFYKTPDKQIKIDSICCDVTFTKGGDILWGGFCGFDFLTKDSTYILKNPRLLPRNLNIYIKVKRIVLSGGRVLINPKVRNETVFKAANNSLIFGVLFIRK